MAIRSSQFHLWRYNLQLISLGLRRYSSNATSDMSIADAKEHWSHTSISETGRLLGRQPQFLQRYAAEGTPIPELGGVYVKTCRVLGSDRHIPLADVHTNTTRRFPIIAQRYAAPILEDKVSGDPVEVYWAPISEERKNNVTVGEVQNQLLTESEREMFGTDLLRLHLLTSKDNCLSDIYFCEKTFVDRRHIHKEWMDILVEMILKLNNHSAYVGDGCEHQLDNVISRKHTMFKFNLLSMMDDKWYPGRLPYLLPHYMNMLRGIVLKHDLVSSTLLQVLRELCIITQVYAPHTAQRSWNMLYSEQHVPEDNELGEQMWPHAERDLKYPVECYALYFNSEGKAVFRESFKRDVTSIASLTAAELTDYCLNAPKFHKMFASHLPNLEVENIDWRKQGATAFSITIKITLKSTQELAERVQIRNAL